MKPGEKKTSRRKIDLLFSRINKAFVKLTSTIPGARLQRKQIKIESYSRVEVTPLLDLRFDNKWKSFFQDD